MSIPTLPKGRAALLFLLGTAGVLASWLAERSSVERANRLHRAGELQAAASIYGERLLSDSTDARLRYNLGTTLLRARVSAAESELAVAAASKNVDMRVRSLYNLALWNLERAVESEAPDSARRYAVASVQAGKQAVRLDPGRGDARWNLAIAQRMLDSIESVDGRAGTESVEGSSEPEELVRTLEDRQLQVESTLGEEPRDGEDETPALPDGGEPLTVLEANDILGSGHLDPSDMIRKLLAYEGRAQRRSRFGRTTPRW